MAPPPMLYMNNNDTGTNPTPADLSVSSGTGDDSRISAKVVVRLVLALVFFLIVLSIVGCVAWSRDRSHQSGTHDAQTGRRRGANTARVSTRRHPRRQHSGRSVSPPPPYLPPAPSYTSLPFAPLCNGRQYDEEPGLDIQMTAAGGERSLPSLPLSRASSRVSPTGRLSAPGTAADLQPPPEAHVARHGLE